MSRDALPTGLCSRIHLGYEVYAHTWEDPEIYQIWTVSQVNQNAWPKEIQKKYPIKFIQTTMKVKLRHCLSLSNSMCLSTPIVLFFPLNKYSTCFMTFHLCGNSFLPS